MNTPTYQPFQVQNSPTQGGMMSANATAESFGGANAQAEAQVGKGLSDAGSTMFGIDQDEQRQLNNDKVRMVLSAYGQKMDEKVSGDFLQRHGAAAINMMPEVNQFHEDLKKNTLESLDNDYQKRVFSDMEADRRYSSMKTVAAHQAKQQQIYHQHSLLAENASALNNAVVNQNDPAELQKHEFTIRQNTLHLYQDDPEAENKANDAVSHMYETIAKTKAQTLSATQALAFMDQHKDKIQEIQRDALTAKFEEKAISEAASSKAQIIASMPGMDEGKARQLVDETIKNPKEAELTFANVKSRLAVNEKMAKDAEKEQTETAWKAFIADPNQTIDPNLPHEEQLKMADYRGKAAKQQTEGEQQSVNAQLLTLPRDKFLNENLFEHRADLSEGQFNFLTKLQEAERKGGTKQTEAFRKAMEDAKEEGKQLSMFKVGEKDSEDKARAKQDALNQYLEIYAKRLQDVPDDKRTDWKTAKDIKDSLLTQTVIRRGLFGNEDSGIPVLSTVNDYLYPDAAGPREFQNEAQGKAPLATPTNSASPSAATTPKAPATPKTVSDIQKLDRGTLFIWEGRTLRKK